MRYVGQNDEPPVEVANGPGRPETLAPGAPEAALLAEYQRSCGRYDAQAPIEIVNVLVAGGG